MKILHAADPYPPHFWGGAEKYAHNLALALKAAGHEVAAVTSREESRAEGDYVHEGVPVKTVQTGNFQVAAFHHADPDFLRTFDVIHLHNFRKQSWPLVKAAVDAGTPLVWTIHDYFPVCPRIDMVQTDGTICRAPANSDCPACMFKPLPRSRGWVARLPMIGHVEQRLLRSRVFPYISRYIAPSRAMARALKTYGIPEERIRMVHNAIPERPFSRLPGNEKVVFVGHLYGDYKGWRVAVAALERLQRRGLSVELILVGRGDLPEVARTVAASGLKNVRIVGPVSDPQAWYDEAELVIVPSLGEETFSLVTLEAFFTGRPVIGSRVGGIPDLIRDGLEGRLVEAGNVGELATAIEGVMADAKNRQEMGLRARTRATTEFSMRVHCERILGVYREAIAGNG